MFFKVSPSFHFEKYWILWLVRHATNLKFLIPLTSLNLECHIRAYQSTRQIYSIKVMAILDLTLTRQQADYAWCLTITCAGWDKIFMFFVSFWLRFLPFSTKTKHIHMLPYEIPNALNFDAIGKFLIHFYGKLFIMYYTYLSLFVDLLL